MKKKKDSLVDLLKKYGTIPAIVIASLTAFGIILRYSYKVITIPERVEAAEQDIVDLKDIIKSQQRINEYYQKKEQGEVIYSPDKKWYWNEEKAEWRPIKELNKEVVDE